MLPRGVVVLLWAVSASLHWSWLMTLGVRLVGGAGLLLTWLQLLLRRVPRPFTPKIIHNYKNTIMTIKYAV